MNETASQKEGFMQNASKNQTDRSDLYYTAYSDVNRILNKYSREAHKDQVFLTIDGGGFVKNMLGERFSSLMELVLEEAYDTCRENVPVNHRYLKIRSLDAHRQLFFKTVYSSDGGHRAFRSKRLADVQDMVDQVGGYFRVLEGDEETAVMISIHQ